MHFSDSNIFFAVSKILVSTGSPWSSRKTSEIINLDNEILICQDVEDYPFLNYPISNAIGTNMDSFPVICGGLDGITSVNQCHRLIAGRWQQLANMTKRYTY